MQTNNPKAKQSLRDTVRERERERIQSTENNPESINQQKSGRWCGGGGLRTRTQTHHHSLRWRLGLGWLVASSWIRMLRFFPSCPNSLSLSRFPSLFVSWESCDYICFVICYFSLKSITQGDYSVCVFRKMKFLFGCWENGGLSEGMMREIGIYFWFNWELIEWAKLEFLVLLETK